MIRHPELQCDLESIVLAEDGGIVQLHVPDGHSPNMIGLTQLVGRLAPHAYLIAAFSGGVLDISYRRNFATRALEAFAPTRSRGFGRVSPHTRRTLSVTPQGSVEIILGLHAEERTREEHVEMARAIWPPVVNLMAARQSVEHASLEENPHAIQH